MIKESLYFMYDGISSMDFNITNVSVDNNLYTDPFLSNRTIKEIVVNRIDKPYYSHIQRDPISFTINFGFPDGWDDDTMIKIRKWLNTDYYKPLIFSEDPQKIYYAMCINAPSVTHNGLKQGYVTLDFRCDSPYAYSPLMATKEYDCTQSDTTNFILENYGDIDIYPQIYLTKIGDGNLTINNINGNTSMQFTGLLDQEQLYIRCEKKYIETSIPNVFRYDSLNDNYMKLVYGQNNIEVSGDCKIKFVYEFKFL